MVNRLGRMNWTSWRRINFSSLAKMVHKHHKIVYCPDEWGMAVHPTRASAERNFHQPNDEHAEPFFLWV